MSKRLNREAIVSEISSVSRLLQSIPHGDILGRLNMEQRLLELTTELSTLEKYPETIAETAIYFGGAPVEGSFGVDATFASEALGKYQDLISIVLAAEKCGKELAESGPIPCKADSTLHITGTPRGSFGFMLKEIVTRAPLIDSPLAAAVEKTSELIELAKEQDTANFQEAIAGEHPRVLASLKDFLRTLNLAKSTARVLTRDHDIQLDSDAVDIAVKNSETLTIETMTDDLCGVFQGATAISRRFDFVTSTGEVITGKITKDIPDERIHVMDQEFAGKPCIATTTVTVVTKQNGRITKKWVLADIRPA